MPENVGCADERRRAEAWDLVSNVCQRVGAKRLEVRHGVADVITAANRAVVTRLDGEDAVYFIPEASQLALRRSEVVGVERHNTVVEGLGDDEITIALESADVTQPCRLSQQVSD